MRLPSVFFSFSYFLINFLLPFVEGTSSGNGNSAVSFTLCDDFTWEQGRHFSLQVASKTDPNALTARFGQGDFVTKFLSRNIQQNDVSFVKYRQNPILKSVFSLWLLTRPSLLISPPSLKSPARKMVKTLPCVSKKGPKSNPCLFVQRP